MDVKLFHKNRPEFPPEELAKHAGQYVAWSTDGLHIVACDENELRLANAIRAAGLNSADVLIACGPVEDEVLPGGGLEVVVRSSLTWRQRPHGPFRL